MSIKERHEIAVRQAKDSMEAWSRQNEAEISDLEFQIPEKQWTTEARQARGGDIGANGVPIPPRPMLSISLFDQPAQLILNQMRDAHLGVNIHPMSPDAEKETAKTMQGLYRKIEQDSNAAQARTWAFQRAVLAGRGFYVVNTVYDASTGEPGDQKIVIERIHDQSMVWLDPSARTMDYRDGKFAFVAAWMNEDTFKAEFPDAEVPTAGDLLWLSSGATQPTWVKTDGPLKSFLVADYWYKEFGDSVEGQEPPVRIMVGKMTSAGFCQEPQELNGKYIPVIPTIGKELQPFDGQRRYQGLIGPNKDGQRLFNYAISQAVESAALEPKQPLIGTAEQVEGYQPIWNEMNTRNYAWLPYNHVEGQAPPTRLQKDSSGMNIAMQLSELARNMFQTGTARFNESLGNGGGQDRSGKAIAALQQQSETANSNWIANMADISMPYEACVILDLMPRIYDRPGRIAQILGEEDKVETVMLNAPFKMEQERPVEAQEGDPQAKMYNLAEGEYSTTVTIGKSYQSRLQQGKDEIGQLIQASPNLQPVLLPTWMRYSDIPGSTEMADMLTKIRDKQFPELAQPKDGEKPTPEQMESMLQAAQGQIQQMQQQLQSAAEAIKTKQVEQQGKVQITQMDNAASLQQEQIRGMIQIELQKMKDEAENLRTGADLETTATEKAKDRTHDLVTASQAQAHAVEQAAVTGIEPYTSSMEQNLPQTSEY